MKKKILRIISAVLCISILVCGISVGSYAAEEQSVSAVQEESAGDGIMKVLYNALNVVVEGLANKKS